MSEVAETAQRRRSAATVLSVWAAVRRKYLAHQENFDGASTHYWREVSKRAWKRALRRAWGDTFAATEATIVPVLVAIFVGVVTGSATRNGLAGLGAGLATAVAWTGFFFIVNLIALPARIHADLVAKLTSAREEIRSYNAVVDRRMVRNLLLRMREKCLTYRSNNEVTVADQVHWASELLGTLSTLYGPEAETALRRDLPYLLDRHASPQTMDFYMRHLADKLLAHTEKVGLDVYSMHKPDLNRFVRKRLMTLQDERLPSPVAKSGLSATPGPQSHTNIESQSI